MKEHNIPKEILRAWFDTVLNPLVNELDILLYRLEQDELNWRFEYQDFTNVKKFKFLIYAKYHPNFEQMKEKFIILDKYEKEYNYKRDELNKSYTDLFSDLFNSKELKQITEDHIKKLNNSDELRNDDAQYLLESNPVKWVADHIVNNDMLLDPHNILKPLWDNYKNEYFKFLEKKEFKKLAALKNKNKSEFERSTRKIFEALIEFRNKLSFNNDVPIVTETIAV